MITANYTQYDQRWRDICGVLKAAEIPVFAPAQHHGKCEAPYVVIRNAGTNKLVGISTTQTVYELLLYVPIDNYSFLDYFSDTVKETMKELYPMIVSLDSEVADYVDSEKKAHMRVLQYRNNRYIQNS